MSLKTRLRENLLTGTIGAAVTFACGLFLMSFSAGDGLVHASYDIPFAFGSKVVPDEVIIVEMDEQSYTELTQVYGQMWNRSLHARLLDRLRTDASKMVVMDIVLADPGPEKGDQELAKAIKNHGRIVLAADRTRIPGVAGEQTRPPRDEFRGAAASWGIARVEPDTDGALRKHYPGTELTVSLAWAAAEVAHAPITKRPAERRKDRWLLYYGPYGTIRSVPYWEALDKPPGFFKGKIVFVGGKPRTRFLGEEVDEFRTPYSLWDGQYSSGVEIVATMFLNLLRGEWLTRLSPFKETCLVLLTALLFGYGLTSVRPLAGAGLAFLGFLGIALLATVLVWQCHVWFSWLIMAGVQIPCAFLWSVLAYTISLYREKAEVEKELATSRGALEAVRASPPTLVVRQPGSAPTIANYTLVRCVGEGAFGQVWLAKNTIGIFHAVKIVSRFSFEDAGPYEREFRGIQKYMPISLNHPSLVPILHVGRNDEAGYFYSIMEAADDEISGQKIDPNTYSPRTLSKDLQRREKLSVAECLSLGLALTTALEFLHQKQLIHRDIKPSNIIFINGVPKLADIGLVTDISRKGEEATQVGTKWYMAPEGPGTPAADLYSLGKVIYVASMGKGADEFPLLPTQLDERTHRDELIQLNRIILKACEEEPHKRYQSAAEMHAQLLRLESRLRPRRG